MATKILTSAFAVHVATTAGGSYTTISGINNMTWEEDAEEIDVTTFDDGGWKSFMNGEHSAAVTVEGVRLADGTTGVRDAGQKMVEKAARDTTSDGGLRYYRIVWKEDPTQYIQFPAYAKLGTFGGGRNEVSPWSVELRLNGEPTFVGAMFDPDDV